MTKARSIGLWGAWALALIAWADVAQAADSVTLKPEVYVKGPEVKLGDIAIIKGTNAEALAALPLTPAAQPGDEKRIDASFLSLRIKNAGFTDADQIVVCGAPSVTAKTLHLELTSQMIAEDLRRFIENHMPWTPENATIEVTGPTEDITTPDGDLSLDWRPSSQYRYVGQGSFRGELRVDGETYRVLNCAVNIDATQDVVVAATDIPRDKIISLADLTLEARPVTGPDVAAFRTMEEVVGQSAKADLAAGQAISARCVAPQLIVRRNQVVTVEAHAAGLVVTTRAKALTDGREGEMLRCQTLEGKDEFTGIVRRDGVVETP